MGDTTSTNPPPAGAEFYRSALKALNGLFDLHVTTAIGHVRQVTISDNDPAATKVELDDPAAKVANTVINTVTGDTTVVYTGDFAGDAELMAMHKEALATAQKIRSDTIELIKKVIADFETLLNRPQGV